MPRKIERKKYKLSAIARFTKTVSKTRPMYLLLVLMTGASVAFGLGYYTSSPNGLTSAAKAQSTLTEADANFKVAFVGDSGNEGEGGAGLELVKTEGAQLLVHLGDFDYGDSPSTWKTMLDKHIPNLPYLAVVGNHDTGKWSGTGGYQQIMKDRVAKTPGMTCTDDPGVKGYCVYKGITFILDGTGLMGSGHEAYIKSALAASKTRWNVCSWHVNMNKLQAGTKGDEAGWGPYEECRKGGAFITNGHEHSYARTKTLTDMTNQVVDTSCPDPTHVCLAKERAFSIVSGMGGHSLRAQSRCLGTGSNPYEYPYGCKGEWAKFYSTKNTGYAPSVLFVTFNANGQANKATAYLKNTKGVVVDQFDITQGGGTTPTGTTLPTTSITPTNPASCDRKTKGDADCDGEIELPDFAIFRDEFIGFRDGTLDINTARADFNSDKQIDLEDFEMFRTGYLSARATPSTTQTPTTSPTTTTRPTVTPTTTTGPTTIPSGKVSATVETDPVPHSGDAADDPAIWVNKADPSKSTIIGTDKQGGLAVYDLAGKQIQYIGPDTTNNVDIRDGISLGGQTVSIVTAGNRTKNTIAIYKVNPTTRQLEDVAARAITTTSVYGSTMYHSKKTGKLYYFINNKSGGVEQYELFEVSGKLDAKKVRTFNLGSQVEGCVADDETGYFYIAEETVGIWRFSAEPDGGTTKIQVDKVGGVGKLVADIEGLTIVYKPDGKYLIASSQGDSNYVVYKINGDSYQFVRKFAIETNGSIDGTSDTDGIDAYYGNLGPSFPNGIFVVQDGANSGGNQNYKYVPLQQIL